MIRTRSRIYHRLWLFALILLPLTPLSSPANVWAAAPLRIAFTEFAPFHAHTDEGALEGFFVDILTEAVEKRLGIPLVWSSYPWKRCQHNVRNGIDDALLTVPTAERLAYASSHPTPFYEKRMHLFTQHGHPRLTLIKGLDTIEAIGPHELTVITYSGNSWHHSHVARLGILSYETDSVANVWRMLAAGRGDLVIEWPHGAWPAIRRLKLADEIVDTGATVAAMPFHLLIRKSSPHAASLPAFEKVIKEMQTDGTLGLLLAPFENR